MIKRGKFKSVASVFIWTPCGFISKHINNEGTENKNNSVYTEIQKFMLWKKSVNLVGQVWQLQIVNLCVLKCSEVERQDFVKHSNSSLCLSCQWERFQRTTTHTHTRHTACFFRMLHVHTDGLPLLFPWRLEKRKGRFFIYFALCFWMVRGGQGFNGPYLTRQCKPWLYDLTSLDQIICMDYCDLNSLLLLLFL